MSIVVLGVNHRTAPLDLLERFSIGADETDKAITTLAERDTIREVAILATCNRFELYAVAEKFHPGYADLRDFLCEVADVEANTLDAHLYSQHDEGAVRHLFRVAAGLDSMVLGESEILGQVRAAGDRARRNGGLRATLDLLFRHALSAGKRARTETGIARGTASVSHAAVELVVDHVDDVATRAVAVIGAGDMGRGVTAGLRKVGVTDLVVVNRSSERAKSLAADVGGRVGRFDELAGALADRDVVVTCTGSGEPILTSDVVTAARPSGRPLLIVDIALPRDTEPAVAELDGVTVLDLDDVRRWADRAQQARRAEADLVRRIVDEEAEQFTVALSARQAAPLVASLHERVDQIRVAELGRWASALRDLDEGQRAAVDALTRALVAKVLHHPSVRLRSDAGTPRGERNAAAVSDLFDLD